jgi:Histidine kinase
MRTAPAKRRIILWPDGFEETTIWRFFRGRVVFTIALDTFIAILITILFQHTWTELLVNFILSQCIGFSVLSLIAVIYFPLSRHFSLGAVGQISIYVVLVPAGIVIGYFLGALLLGRPGITWVNWAVPIVFSIIAATVAYLYNIGRALVSERERRAERAERVAVEAQLKVLQAQIEPHFLFNTLATLDALIATDRDQARSMLQHLIRYLRAALTHSRSETSTLGTELDLLQAYLSIMKLRLPNRLQTEVECDDACRKLPLPPMLLQPLVENAITHGVEPAKDGATIRIRAHCSDNLLDIAVEDTGVGLGNSPTAGTGAGTENVRNRLASLFGADASLTLEAIAPHGTRSRIRIPLATPTP